MILFYVISAIQVLDTNLDGGCRTSELSKNLPRSFITAAFKVKAHSSLGKQEELIVELSLLFFLFIYGIFENLIIQVLRLNIPWLIGENTIAQTHKTIALCMTEYDKARALVGKLIKTLNICTWKKKYSCLGAWDIGENWTETFLMTKSLKWD